MERGHWVWTDEEGSSVASPICQEGQSERNFPIFAFSSRFILFFLIFFLIFPRFFPLFSDLGQIFRCQGWHSAPPRCHPSGYATGRGGYMSELSSV